MSRFVISTALGQITLRLLPDAAPGTVEYLSRLVKEGLYNGCCFYRSDFVIQCGLQRPDGSGVENPHGVLQENETHKHRKVSNVRGTAAVAHWDVPDCGAAEFFINLKANAHLDEVYGGYCVFAEVADEDSFRTVDAIAAAVPQGQKPLINSIVLAP
eukprot:TRINITY_DN11985_c0_g1_i1.p3 TRINITY_DN11985_c0_g1~~TRINITY_DN11985_c0_g1_i1.p3  ORF type:complete len:182 (+),score=83.61 TRINITY_DN11985_c0_g1_i1:77-547(+)